MIAKTCPNCGAAFRVRERDAGQKCCTRACSKAYGVRLGRPAIVPVAFTCKTCGGPFEMKTSYLTAYRKKHGKDPLYCSAKCMGEGFRTDADERHKTTCVNCGAEFYRTRRNGAGTIYREQKLCSKSCKNAWVSKIYREKHGTPEITKTIARGYVRLRVPTNGGERAYKEVFEHRYVMEQHIGRPLLREETVHHINGVKTDNHIENLELCASNHGPGQAVTDLVAWCVEMLNRYPQFLRAIGWELVRRE